MLKQFLFGGTLLATLLLAACHHSVDNFTPQSTSGSSVSSKILPSKDITYLYLCENDIEIKVTVLNALAIKQHSKNPSIQLTLNKTKQHLQPIVSDSGKRYANIQWNWWEKAQSAVLSNSVGEVIVDGCIKH